MQMTQFCRGTSGVYVIENMVTRGRYYGSAQCLRKRCAEHLNGLRAQRHENTRLQRSWNKHGEAAFAFRVLAVLEKNQVRETEQRLLDRCFGLPGCYNASADAFNPMAGRSHSAETKARMSEMRRGRPGRPATPEARARLTALNIDRRGKPLSAEHKKKVGIAGRGRKRSAESVAKSADSHRGKSLTAETKAKIAATKTGKALSPEHRAALSASRVGMKRSAESVEKSAASHRGKPRPASVREKIAAALRGKPLTAERRANQSAAKLAYWAAKKANT